MSKKYLLLCNRHNSVFGEDWCLWWGKRENAGGYNSDIRLAHRFTEDEIEEYKDELRDIPVPIDILGIPEEYEPEETYNPNFKVLVERITLNKLMNLELKPLFEDDGYCSRCGQSLSEKDLDNNIDNEY